MKNTKFYRKYRISYIVASTLSSVTGVLLMVGLAKNGLSSWAGILAIIGGIVGVVSAKNIDRI